MRFSRDEIDVIECISMSGRLSNLEKLNAVEKHTNGDFWRACDLLIICGWDMEEFGDDAIRAMFGESFDNPVEENMEYLRDRINDYAIYGVKADSFYDEILSGLGITAECGDEEIEDLARTLDEQEQFDDDGNERWIIGTFEYLRDYRNNLREEAEDDEEEDS